MSARRPLKRCQVPQERQERAKALSGALVPLVQVLAVLSVQRALGLLSSLLTFSLALSGLRACPARAEALRNRASRRRGC